MFSLICFCSGNVLRGGVYTNWWKTTSSELLNDPSNAINGRFGGVGEGKTPVIKITVVQKDTEGIFSDRMSWKTDVIVKIKCLKLPLLATYLACSLFRLFQYLMQRISVAGARCMPKHS